LNVFSFRNLLLGAATALIVLYCVSVLYHVQSAWDSGLRGLFATETGEATTVGGTRIGWSEDAVAADGDPPHGGDLVVRVADREVTNALRLPQAVAEVAPDLLPNAPTVATLTDLRSLPATTSIAEVDGRRWVRVDYLRSGEPELRSTWLQLKPGSRTAVWLSLAWFLLEMVIFSIGAFVVWKRPGDATALLFFLLCTVNAVTFMGAFHWHNLIGSKALVYPFVFCAMLLAPITLHFFALFPRPLGVIRANPRLSQVVIYLVPGIWMLYLFYQIWRIDRLYFVPEASAELSQRLGKLAVTIYGYLAASAAMYLVGFGVLIYRFLRGRSNQERRQVQGLLAAVMLTTGPVGYLLWTALHDRAEFAFGPLPKLMVYLTSLVFTTAYGLSITRYKLMPLGQIVNRGILYVGISSLATVLFCTLVGLATALVGQYYFRWENALVAGLTAMVIVVFLGWFRDRFQKSLDRNFYREKYRLDKAVRQLGAAVDRLVEPTQLAKQLLSGAREAVGIARGSVYLRNAAGDGFARADHFAWPEAPQTLPSGHPLLAELSLTGMIKAHLGTGSRTLQAFGAEAAFLLELEGTTIGAAFFGRRDDGAAFSPEDTNFLSALVRTTTLALSTAQGHRTILSLKEELQEKVAKISDQQRRIMYLQDELFSRSDAHVEESPTTTKADPKAVEWSSEILGSSPAVRDVLDKAARVALSPSSVLVRGESGTGKELLARAIHDNSPRSTKPFVVVHCAALSSSLLESELFGHVKGAFTGADRDKIGRFEMADGGTLFLDEIGDINLETQTKLLRVLQERNFERVGGTQTISVDVRLIAATHQNLEEFIRQSKFREDLYYRLNVISLRCPSLRERKDDVFELALHFLRSHARKDGRSPTRIEEDALEVLMSYDWPGNIRQLENALERAIVLCEGEAIRVDDLPPEVLAAVRSQTAASERPEQRREARTKPRRAAAAPVMVVTAPAGLSDALDDLERERLSEALVRTNGNKAEAARLLGLPRSTLFSKLRKYGLE
jgi:transcriptional regulator with GAF, ATPase, and Fis domain